MLPFSILLALTFSFSSAFPDSDLDTVFTQGLESFKRSDLAQSRGAFLQLINDYPNDPSVLYNLGLVEFKDQHPGRALAYWRKALYLSPGYSPALQGLSHLKQQKYQPVLQIPFSTEVYWRIPLLYLFLSALLSLSAFAFFMIRWMSKKKLGVPPSLIAPAFLGFLGLITLAAALHDFQTFQLRSSGTIMETSAPVHSSPSNESPALFEFKEGDEVTVRREAGEWLQVQKSATSIGWLKKNQLFLHSGPSAID